MEVEEGELIEGIEANDVGTLLEQFLKYEEKQGSQDPASSVSLLISMEGTSCLPQDLVSQRTNYCDKETMDSSSSTSKNATTNSSKECENLSPSESSRNQQLYGDLNRKNRKKDEQKNHVDNHATDHNYACSGFPLRKAPLVDSVNDGCGAKNLSRSSPSRSLMLDQEEPCKTVLVREAELTHHNERQHCENEDKKSRIPKRYRGRYCEDSSDESSFEDDNYKRRYSSDPDRQNQGRKRVRKGTYSSDEENFYKIKKRRHSISSDERNYSSSDESDKDECRYDARRSTSSVPYHRYSSGSERDSSRHNQRKERSNSQEQSRWDTGGRKDKKCHDVELERKMGFKFDQNIKCTGKEERRIVYVGKISNKTTKDDVWRRFRPFGPIEKVTVHFRDDGDNYAFVTFFEYSSAAEAIERRNEDPSLEVLDICFGGRRKFCGGSYVDFDSNTSCLEEGEVSRPPSSDEMDFDALLRLSQRTLKSREESSFRGR